jgi:transposase-like protein
VRNQNGGVKRERVPNGRYTKEFREEAVKMVTEGGLSVLEVSSRLSLPKSTFPARGRESIGPEVRGVRAESDLAEQLHLHRGHHCRYATRQEAILSLCLPIDPIAKAKDIAIDAFDLHFLSFP